MEIDVERRRKDKSSIIRFRDFADGMTGSEMEEKLSATGGRVSGFEKGAQVRGTNSRGTKDAAALGRVTFESIAEDGKYHKCQISEFLVLNLYESQTATKGSQRETPDSGWHRNACHRGTRSEGERSTTRQFAQESRMSRQSSRHHPGSKAQDHSPGYVPGSRGYPQASADRRGRSRQEDVRRSWLPRRYRETGNQTCQEGVRTDVESFSVRRYPFEITSRNS